MEPILQYNTNYTLWLLKKKLTQNKYFNIRIPLQLKYMYKYHCLSYHAITLQINQLSKNTHCFKWTRTNKNKTVPQGCRVSWMVSCQVKYTWTCSVDLLLTAFCHQYHQGNSLRCTVNWMVIEKWTIYSKNATKLKTLLDSSAL